MQLLNVVRGALVLACCLCISAQEIPPDVLAKGDAGEVTGTVVAGGDVDALIANLVGVRSSVTKTRVFSGGVLQEQYPVGALAIDRAAGTFDARASSLVVTGSIGGTPVIEDFRFVESDGTLYVLRDVYLNGQPEDVSTGRATPVPLTEDAASGFRERAGAVAISGTRAVAPTPQVTAIHGYSDDVNVGIVDGIVHMVTCGARYDGGRVVNNEPTTFSWDVYGANFGNTKGSITLAGMTIPPTAIAQWTNTFIRFYPTVPINWGPVSAILWITNTSGGSLPTVVSIVPAIKTRIFGQCTWYVALARLNAGKQPSASAYPPGTGWSQITGSYAPQQWDQLTWDWYSNGQHHKHTAIIANVTGPTRNGNTLSWTVTIGESNAACNNQITTRTSTFQVQNGTIVKTIQTNATTLAPGWFYR